MNILEYDDIDPVQAMYVSRLALNFALTPEKAASIRQADPRPFPCLAIYALEGSQVLGQVGVFRLPMISSEGREDVGGIWAVSTHPQYAGKGVASLLLEQAHARMRQAGLRFSTLGTDRYRVAYQLYRKHGYVDTYVYATALASWETAHQPTRLRAESPGPGGYELVERIFDDIAHDYFGFAWRHTPFARLRLVDLEDIWILREHSEIVGYAFAGLDQSILNISNIVLRQGADAAEAVAAIAAVLKTAYIQVQISRPAEIASLRRAGYHVAHPSWDAFMIKSLVPEVSVDDASRLFGISTDRFLISWLDVT